MGEDVPVFDPACLPVESGIEPVDVRDFFPLLADNLPSSPEACQRSLMRLASPI
jgi:hypothetical protein